MERKLRMPECYVCACPGTAAFKEAKRKYTMNEQKESAALGRIIGLDLHPDVFSAAALGGRDAATAKPVQQWDRLATAQLETWAKSLVAGDLVVLEASGNSFDSCERLQRCGVATIVLESQRAGQIRKTYCANDRSDAVKLARIYLSGLAQPVWQPDATTRERREVLHAYRKAVTTATRTRNRLKSFLSDHGIRLKPGVRLVQASGQKTVRGCRAWSALQAVLIEQMLEELKLADGRRGQLSAVMAQEVAADPKLLPLVRLLGVRHIIAFAIAAVVGDITRFANPKKLVAYLGLAPTVDQSGNGPRGQQGLVTFGRGDLRALLTQSAQNALNQRSSPLHTWGWKLCLRKSHKNVAIAAIARKLTVSIWYMLRGLFTPLKQVDASLKVKLAKIATTIGVKNIRHLGYKSKVAFIEEKSQWLLNTA
jgi:transposase